MNNYKLTADGFGIHTFELTMASLTKDTYYCLYNRLKESTGKNHIFYKGTTTIFHPTQANGINFILNKPSEKDYYFTIIITPCTLMNGGYEFYKIYSNNSGEQLEAAINRQLTDILGDEYTLDKFKVSRIDCCINIMLDGEFSAKRYVKLIRRSITRNTHDKEIPFNNTDENYKDKNKHSFRLQSGDVIFTAYDKWYQLSDMKNPIDEDTFFSISDSMLRLELAFNRDYIREEQKEYNLNTNILIINHFVNNSRSYFSRYINNHSCKGDYFTLASACDTISKSDKKTKLKNHMINFLQAQTRKSSISKAINDFKVDLCNPNKTKSDYILNNVMNAFDELCINPITVSCRDISGDFCVDGLYSIFNF